MYLHLGKGTVVDDRDIIGIFDLDITSQSHITRKYLNAAERSGEVVNVAEDIPKSFVVTKNRDKVIVYLCQMACTTLLKRSEAGIT